MRNFRMNPTRAAVLTLICIMWPLWALSDDGNGNGNGNGPGNGHGYGHSHDDGDGGDTDITIDVTGGDGGDGGAGGAGGDGGDGGDGYGGEGGDANSDANSDANASADSQQNVTFEGSRSPGRGYIGGGSSTASDQKVRAISGGWLTGMASLRWDATDKELRTLRRADALRDRGMISAADKLECSARVIYKAIGGNPDACYTELAGSHVVVSEKRTQRDVEQDQLILALQAQLAELQQQAVPEIAEEQTVVRREVQQVSQAVKQEAATHSELEKLAAQYRADRAAEQRRLAERRDYAQSTLKTLEQKGYTATPQAEELDDEDE